jgi:hypothetical protein
MSRANAGSIEYPHFNPAKAETFRECLQGQAARHLEEVEEFMRKAQPPHHCWIQWHTAPGPRGYASLPCLPEIWTGDMTDEPGNAQRMLCAAAR